MSLQKIAKQIEVCEKCSLSKTRINTVPGEGNLKTKILFIGEGPGQKEDELGRPFIGSAGNFLDYLLSTVDLQRKNVFITNIVKCRPPQNRDPLPEEIKNCFPYLKKQIEEINPQTIVTLGRYSLNTFLPNKKISSCHGKIYKTKDLIILPLYHPAAALHNENLKETIIRDFQKIKLILKRNKELKQKSLF